MKKNRIDSWTDNNYFKISLKYLSHYSTEMRENTIKKLSRITTANGKHFQSKK